MQALLTWVFGCAIIFVEKIRQYMAACCEVQFFHFQK